MKNLRCRSIAFFLFAAQFLFSQNPAPERQAEFAPETQGLTTHFTPQMPPLMQKAGAPKAYYSYFWEFGDGSFSKEENPVHTYANAGDYIVSLDATAHYDDGKKAKKKKKTVAVAGRSEAMAGVGLPDVFEKKSKQAVAMAANAKPKAEEELTIVISYRNNSFVTTNGRLHLFFNEKKFKASHFDFLEARTHFGETADPLISQILPTHTLPTFGWTALSLRSSTGASASWSGDLASFSILQDMLNNARGAYREEKAWRFTDLAAGAKRNLFISLASTANMLKDTSAFIHLEAVFAPDDPAVPPERFEMEIEIVASHDPNVIAVSDNRVSYRSLGDKKFDYKVQFQNNGEGPASTVELKVEIPEGLDMTQMRPTEWYPKCPICPKIPDNRSCLDTTSSKTGLTFTFRNIYLPGSRQKDVDDRDSTKGFVKYRIEADEDMPKRSFRSRAKIIFDKNPPIYTNYTKTRFKPGISPGLKAGYNFVPDSSKAGYFFLGGSLSPYKSWRMYPQIELLAGIKGQAVFSGATTSDSIPLQYDEVDIPGAVVSYVSRYALVDSVTSGERGFIFIEMPVLLRKNFSRFFGAGIGGSVRFGFDNGEKIVSTTGYIYDVIPHYNAGAPVTFDTKLDTVINRTQTTSYSEAFTQYTVFGDFSFGSVRAGPNLGIRAGALLERRRKPQLFVQVSLEMKL
jgi:PKD repeat protein